MKYKIIKSKLGNFVTNNILIHYQLTKPDDSKLTYAEFLNLLKAKDKDFIREFDRQLSQAPTLLSQSPTAFFWECVPVSKVTLNKGFEFVAIKSEALGNITCDYSTFAEHFNRSRDNNVVSFASFSGDTLVVPMPVKNNGELQDYKNLKEFNCNSSLEQKESFWQKVGEKMAEALEKDKEPKWLSTHGLGVSYLHVRIDKKPKYYSYEEYKTEESQPKDNSQDIPSRMNKSGSLPVSQEPESINEGKGVNNKEPVPRENNDSNKNYKEQKEKILRNLDKIIFDWGGHIANAKVAKNISEIGLDWKKAGAYQIKIDNEEINLLEFEREEREKDYLEIRKAVINNIKKNISDWEIEKDKRNQNVLQNKKTGVRVWTIIFRDFMEMEKKDWTEIEAAIKKIDSEKKSFDEKLSTSENKQTKNEFPWKIVLPMGAVTILLLGIIIFVFWRKKNSTLH